MLQSSKVVNGWDASEGQFPFAAFLDMYYYCKGSGAAPISSMPSVPPSTTSRRARGTRGSAFCGSSLIMPRVLVTAGHCVGQACASTAPTDSLPGEVSNLATSNLTWAGPIIATMNQLDVTIATSNFPNAEQRVISGAIRHPRYKPSQYDIALLWFDKKVNTNPVQIAQQTEFSLGQQFMVAGWGITDTLTNKVSKSKLKTAQVPFVPHTTCSTLYSRISSIWGSNICAGGDSATHFADTCNGDSGGPMVMNATSPICDGAALNASTCVDKQLVGLTSFGSTCAIKIPGVYVNVPKQSAWIDETITLRNMGGIEVPQIGCSSHVGHSYFGASNSTFSKIPNAAQCCNLCKVMKTCRSWTWNSGTKKCVTLDAVEKRVLNSAFTSGNVTG